MGPEGIILSEQSTESEAKTAKTQALPVITPISVELFEKVARKGPCTTFEGCRVFGNTTGITDFSDIPLYYYCKCVQLDLAEESARVEYSELLGKSLAINSPITLLWEERVISGEKMILYLTFSEQVRIVELSRE